MGFAPRFTPDAEDEITEFVLRFPDHLQDHALDLIEKQLGRFAANPRILGRAPGSRRPIFPFTIRVAGVLYPLAVGFVYTQDEQALLIHTFRVQSL